MKPGTHPNFAEVTINCACGNQIKTVSTSTKGYNVDICSKCHPFFTGQQRLLDATGRVEKFTKKYANVKPKTTKK